jgi:cell division protein FtsI/penicillin-binding protein 2
LEAVRESYAESDNPHLDSNGRPLTLIGLETRPHLIRAYPEGELAYNVLGFVNLEGSGAFGVEGRYDRLLTGQPLHVRVSNDPSQPTVLPAVPAGASLILTIDREIQAMVEDVLQSALDSSGAEAGTILVMHPETGEMLAMASAPQINPNEFWDFLDTYGEDKDIFYNMAISSYEPGSVFKIITMATALELDVVEPDTVYIDTGYINVGGIPIYNWDGGPWGPQTMLGCMQHSLNVCLAYVATQIGPSDFYASIDAFGFGRQTGIELAGESAGEVRRYSDGNWYPSDLATNSFGQGIAVTPIQMITALSAIANDGQMMTPHIVQAVIDQGQQYNTTPQVIASPISAETARTITEMLAVSLEQEASVALVEGYRVAGKTGTAEIPTQYGYTSELTNASFAGWGPVDDPQFLVYVWLQRPTSSPWGSVVAAPVFRQVVERLVVLMDLPPDQIRQAMAMP